MELMQHHFHQQAQTGGVPISTAQGAIGQKISVHGTVVHQISRAVDTAVGRVYSHSHIILDDRGNLYHYRGSSLFPKGNKVAVVATVKAHLRGPHPRSQVTIIKAPKPI